MEHIYGNHIRLRYCGPTNTKPSRWLATWQGWPSEGGRPVKRYISADQHDDQADAAEVAAKAFAAWLDSGSDGHGNMRREPASITMAAVSPDEYSVIVKLREITRAVVLAEPAQA